MTDTNSKPAGLTPSQTVGPWFKYGLTPGSDYAYRDTFSRSAVTPDAEGERIRIKGRVLDGDGKPVPDAMVEIWQADAAGRLAHPRDSRARANTAFKGFARSDTAPAGEYTFDTIKPGAVPGPGGKTQAPHILFALFSRGILRHLYSRMYFAEETTANAADPILALVPAERRHTIIAKRDAEGTYVFDLRMQGGDETVFFDI
jgi:protocatechuate 3,4-dioxygenase, alpha subunit